VRDTTARQGGIDRLISTLRGLAGPRGVVHPMASLARSRSVQAIIAAARLPGRRARGLAFRDFNGQVHGSQNPLGNVFGPDECDQTELGLALGTNNLKPECFSQQLCPRNVPRLAGGLVQSGGLRGRCGGATLMAGQERKSDFLAELKAAVRTAKPRGAGAGQAGPSVAELR
jgi:hypothetical protein